MKSVRELPISRKRKEEGGRGERVPLDGERDVRERNVVVANAYLAARVSARHDRRDLCRVVRRQLAKVLLRELAQLVVVHSYSSEQRAESRDAGGHSDIQTFRHSGIDSGPLY